VGARSATRDLSLVSRQRQLLIGLVTLVVVLAGCSSDPPVVRSQGVAPTHTVEVVQRHPHDPRAFTQGLELDADSRLYESSGQYGQSALTVGRVGDGAGAGQEQLRVDFADVIFAEGLTIVDDEVFVLSWREQTAFVFDRRTLEPRRQLSYEGEGWGLCFGGSRLVMSNGSDELTFRDPQTFEATGSVRVAHGEIPVTMLNELECDAGTAWANIWQSDLIVNIDLGSGEVLAVVDAAGLLSEAEAADANVLNGIARRPDTDTWYLTGKYWPWLFEVSFRPIAAADS